MIIYNSNRNLYSRWASEAEIKPSLYRIEKNNCNPEFAGIPLFSDSDSVYVEKDDSHTCIFGSTGAKKTRLIGMPTLRFYALAGESFIATDPKAELYEKTLPMLKKLNYQVFIFNLRNPKYSNNWNPLMIPFKLYIEGQRDKAIETIIDMANCIVKEGSPNDPYWQQSTINMLAGLILILFECASENEIHFKSLRALRVESFRHYGDEGSPYIREQFLNYLHKSSFVYSMLSGVAEVTGTTRSCIISTFDQAMRPFFSQDNLIDMLSASELDMKKIGKIKTAVFLVIPDENTLYHRLITIFIKQCYTELILEAQRQKSGRLPIRVNFLLDEFSALPPISDFPSMITASRSRNIRFNLIIQSMHQLHEFYGNHAETIKGNCNNWVFLHSRELSLLNEIVNLCGNKSSEEKLVSVSMLQTLDKNKGEAFIFHNRLYPFIAELPDIDIYPPLMDENLKIDYPVNSKKAKNIFDFEKICEENTIDYFLGLFNDKKFKKREFIVKIT